VFPPPITIMAGSVKQIEHEIALLEEAIADIAQELHQCYSDYLQVLGDGLRQQLILATYHLCTQGYPEAFLKLSFARRQELQSQIRHHVSRSQNRLFNLVRAPISEQKPPSDEAETSDDVEPSPDRENTENEDNQKVRPSISTLKPISPSSPKPLLITPSHLLRWQENIEEATAKILHRLSHEINLLLQQSTILPQELPVALIEAASKTEPPLEATAGNTPNLLTLMVETEDENEEQTSRVTQLITVHLRISEIEFSDPRVMAGRHQIRNVIKRLNQLGRNYQKKLRERAVLQAEAAWRSSWFDE